MKSKKWLVSRTNPEFLDYLAREASISRILAQVLINRGIREVESIKNFLNPSIGCLHDPFLLPDMEPAVIRLKKAFQNKEKILVHGDYDADGLTSTALLVSVLRSMGLETLYHIPDRFVEGYGLSRQGIDKAADSGASLVITADCGVSSVENVLYANSRGMDVIVTDHHEPPEQLPEAVAVIDPHRADSGYPFKFLAGVGVAFKLCQAIVSIMNSREIDLTKCLDLVAVGTVADSVPLIDENRVFVSSGLELLNNPDCRAGFKSLKHVSGSDKEFRSVSLSYTLIPRINATGRLEHAGEAVELLLTDDAARAQGIAEHLDMQNRRRQRIEAEVLQSAVSMLEKEGFDNAIVLSSDDWHPGVIGIVASKIVDMFNRPAFLFSKADSMAKGSARGIDGLDLYAVVSECSDILISFGGHKMAAGLRIESEILGEFKKRINSIVGRVLKNEDLTPVLEIDAAVNLSEVNINLVNELSLLEPFGESNNAPVFGARDVRVLSHRIVGNNHLKMLLRQGGVNIDTIGFGMGDQLHRINTDAAIDIAFIPNINEWQGARNVQLNLKAIRPSP